MVTKSTQTNEQPTVETETDTRDSSITPLVLCQTYNDESYKKTCQVYSTRRNNIH